MKLFSIHVTNTINNTDCGVMYLYGEDMFEAIQTFYMTYSNNLFGIRCVNSAEDTKNEIMLHYNKEKK